MANLRNITLFSPICPTGGIATWTLNLLEYIKNIDGQSFCFLDASIYFKKGVNSTFLFYRFISGIFDTIILLLKYFYHILIKRPSVIHICSSASLALFKDIIYLFVASLFRIKVVFHYHFGRIPILYSKKNWEWYLIVFCIKHSKHIIVIDSNTYDVLCKNGFCKMVSYIPNPCSSKVESIARMPIVSKKKNHFLFVGHVIPYKGVFELVSVFSKISEPLTLTLVGLCDSKTEKDLRSIASVKNAGDWLSIVGNREQEYVFKQMQVAEALILPSYTEGFPNVIIEAMACGCPILATSVGAIPEMLEVNIKERSCGICFSPRSEKSLFSVLIDFLTNEDLKNQYAINGKKRVLSSYTLDRVYPLYDRVWNF